MGKTVLREGDEGVLLVVKNLKAKRLKSMETRISTRSPVHVVYGGANLFKSDTPQKLGSIALKSLESYAPNFVEFANAMWLKGCETLPGFAEGIDELEKQLEKDDKKVKAENYAAWFAWTVHRRTIAKLKTEPVEDFRIDFEDGYGLRSDGEEDADTIAAARELAASFRKKTNTQFSGFRIKSLSTETRVRAIRTLNLFFDTFLKTADKKLPNNFVVTLPKVTDKKEVAKLGKILTKIERKAGLHHGSIKIEIMIEHPLAIIDKKGNAALRSLVEAACGRCVAAHFGAFDYTASLGIAAVHQHLRHDACDFARQMMLTALSPLDIRLSDSATMQMPVPVHKGTQLSDNEKAENKHTVISGWRAHFNNVTHSMINGFYQSWDLHPNQLVARYAAVYSFFLDSADIQAERLKAFIAEASQATLTGNTFDDAASARGLINFFARAVDCGALTHDDIQAMTGKDVEGLYQVLSPNLPLK